MATLTCFHICYDEATRAACPSDFTPLLHDNRMPDLKEIIPIYEYLKGHRWLPDEFIGFFSPRFKQKTGLDFCDVFDAYDRHKESTDAVFFTSYWDAASLYLNPWEQGEFSNPGLLRVSQSFADRLGLNIDLKMSFVASTKPSSAISSSAISDFGQSGSPWLISTSARLISKTRLLTRPSHIKMEHT